MTQKRDHAHRQALGVLTKKIPVPRFNFIFSAPNRISASASCFGSGNGVAF
jgi:hypothetical protein